ncbi:MAG TPA: hypothetical protein ACFYED_00165 [Candidatus Tripitaka californicus]|uniref:hypothetical protein n=1 Tax=Candidatus Tripitaka californicus TaxID=3367616 RepID=UPI00402777B0
MAVDIIRRYTRDALIRQQGNSNFTREMLQFITPDIVSHRDDFLGAMTIANKGYIRMKDAVGGSLPVLPGTLTVNGDVDFVTGATDDGYSALATGLQYRGDLSAVFCAILKPSAITGLKMEVGFTDATGTDGSTATDVGAINVLATPSKNASDCALWIFDTDDTDNVAWQCIGVKGDSIATKVEPTNIGNKDGDAAPNADQYDVLIVALRETDARFYRGDMVDVDGNDNEKRLTLTYDSGWNASFITSSTLLTPWIFCQTRAGAASRTVSVDYWHSWQFRYAEEI